MQKELVMLSEATAASEEAISNAKIVKAFSREDYEIKRYKTLGGRQFDIARKRARLQSSVEAATQFLGIGGLAAFLWYSGTAVLSGSQTVGSLITLVMYVLVLSRPFIALTQLYGQLQLALGATARIFDLLDQPVTLTDKPGAHPLPPMQGDLRFEQVTFSYDGHIQVLHDVSFEAEQGKVVALVGPSGAGKTTIANLISRFFEVKSGRITIDRAPGASALRRNGARKYCLWTFGRTG
jgi:subfamily B ATP-binding cassette protein MsbA